MRFKKLRINNIRSYQEAEIELENGITLLSGDIGSGKTSLLMAIEFALFGILRGEVAADELLRHGSNKASVELEFSAGKHNYVIRRNIKRTNNGVVQDSGLLIVDEVNQELTATELKAKILKILGYPSEYQSKSKNFIYRFTTYTPQEEVKKILLQPDEIRIDTIRKIFNIDKYKIAKDNTSELIRELRRKIQEGNNSLQEETVIQKKVEESAQLVQNNQKIIVQLEKEIFEKNEEQKIILEQIEKFKIKSQQSLLQQKENQNKLNLIQSYEQQISTLRSDLPQEVEEPENLVIDTEQVENKILDTENKANDVRIKIAKIEANNSIILDSLDKMTSLSECPTCKQEVTEEHKQKHEEEAKKELASNKEKLVKLVEYQGKAENNLLILKNKLRNDKEKLTTLRLQKQKYNHYKLALENFKKNAEIKHKLEENIIELKENIIVIEEFDNTKLNKLVGESKELEKSILQKNSELSSTKTEITFINNQVTELKSQLVIIKEIKLKLKKKETTIKWLSEYFTKSLSLIENKVLNKINLEFNEHFQNWFNMLLEDESITAKIDENYSPYIVQNGEITQFRNLSGGEKTSMALAYRLALNQVINEFVSNLQTKQIIILDEPTDGFSAQQLDKLRDVIENLTAKQIIIVSHEEKLESAAQRIIRVVKQGHISRVV